MMDTVDSPDPDFGPTFPEQAPEHTQGLISHWWRDPLLWITSCNRPRSGTGSGYLTVKPSYEAFSLLKVEPSQPQLFDHHLRTVDEAQIQPYLQTQLGLLTSDRVLEVAVARKDVVNLPMIKESIEPRRPFAGN